MIFLLVLVLISLLIYSYALVDPNLTLFNHSLWNIFREKMVYLGYYQRNISWFIYLITVIFLFALNYFFIKNYKKHDPFKIALLIGSLLLLSYPFLSHDFFNYMFDARILTFYHQNPYFKKALDFPNDPWIRFMHWTHRTYPYGPIFLLISLVPSFFSFGKFLLAFIFFKGTFVSFYLIAVYLLNKINKKWAIIFATHPLVIIEGLISPHNDMIAVSLAIIGIYFLINKKNIWSRFLLLVSGGIKYTSLPLILLSKSNRKINYFVFALSIIPIIYLGLTVDIQQWYFLIILAFLPFFPDFICKLWIFFLGVLLSYYPYIKLGGWDSVEKVMLKKQIIIVFLILNGLYMLINRLKNNKSL